MCSISAGIASSLFTLESRLHVVFDARCFILPEEEVCNYFIWRQQDWTRNAIQMIARTHYSHKELINKSIFDLQEMLFQKGDYFDDYKRFIRRGRCIVNEEYTEEYYEDHVTRTRWVVDNSIPIFTQDRNYIEKYLVKEEE